MKFAILSGIIATTFAGHARADATAMCLEGDGATVPQCECATTALAEEAGAADADLYDKVGALYLGNKSSGQSMGDAWDAAISQVAVEAGLGRTELMSRMNTVGQVHRSAIATCG